MNYRVRAAVLPMKKNISINLQGIIFHIEDDGYDVLSRYLQEVKAHFASYQGLSLIHI